MIHIFGANSTVARDRLFYGHGVEQNIQASAVNSCKGQCISLNTGLHLAPPNTLKLARGTS